MDEAVVRIILQEALAAGGQSTRAQSSPTPTSPSAGVTPPSQPTKPYPVPPPPTISPADIRSVESYKQLNAAIGQARKDAEAFGKSMEGVQGSLFHIRQGIDPKAIADIFTSGKEAASDLVRELGKINYLLEQEEIGPAERLRLAKVAISKAATTVAAEQQGEQTPAITSSQDFLKPLINPAEGANPHVLIEGQSGSGKSLMTRHIAFQRMQQGQDVHVVDTHQPELWGGAKQVFQGETAGTEAADFLKATLAARKQEASEAKARGEQPDFKPMSVVFSDFARLMKDTPQLGEEFRTLLTEARKFRISIIADTTALTGAATGIKGIQDVINNFGQRVKLYAPTAQGEPRKAEVAGQTYKTPQLPEYKERIDYSLIRPPAPPKPEPPPADTFNPHMEAEKQRERERRQAQVQAAYREKFGGDEAKGPMDDLLRVAGQFRGAIGGFSGVLVGATLDAVAAFQKAQADVQDRRKEAQLLGEAKGLAQEAIPSALPAKGEVRDVLPAGTIRDVIPAGEGTTAEAGVGGAGGIVEAAGAAVPIVGATLAVKAAMEKINKDINEGIKSSIHGVGRIASTITSPDTDPSIPIRQLGDATSRAGEKIDEYIPVAGKLVMATGEVGKAFADLIQNIDKTATRYGEYSPEIAQVQAMADISHTLGDLRRSREAGPELARYVRARADMQEKFEDIKIKLLERLLPIITKGMEGITTTVDKVEDMIELTKIMVEALTLRIPTAVDHMREYLERKDRSDMVGPDPTEVILRDLILTSREQGEVG